MWVCSDLCYFLQQLACWSYSGRDYRLRWLMDQWWCSDGKIEGPGIRKSSKAFSRQTPHHLILAPQRGAHSSKPLLDHNKTTQDHYYTTTRQPLKISAVLHAIIYQLRFQSLVQGGRSWNDLEPGSHFFSTMPLAWDVWLMVVFEEGRKGLYTVLVFGN